MDISMSEGERYIEACLFIGGPWDGRRELVPDSLEVMQISADDSPGIPKRHTYKAQRLACGGRAHRVFYHESLQVEELVECLVLGYASMINPPTVARIDN